MVNLGFILLEIMFEGPDLSGNVSYAKCPQEVTFIDSLQQTRYCPKCLHTLVFNPLNNP